MTLQEKYLQSKSMRNPIRTLMKMISDAVHTPARKTMKMYLPKRKQRQGRRL